MLCSFSQSSLMVWVYSNIGTIVCFGLLFFGYAFYMFFLRYFEENNNGN